MPEAHRHSLPVQLEQILWRAQRIGPDMQLLVQARIDSVPQPVAALRACLGLIRYAENCHDRKKANRAARFALERRMISCPQFEKILRMGAAENREEDELGVVCHDNLQGLSILAQEG